MKSRLATRLEKLGQQAAKVRQVVEAAPGKAAELRNVVALTTAQIQQLRADLQAGLTGLRADSEEHLLRALAEIEAHREDLLEAGLDLVGVDLDAGGSQQLVLHLDRFETFDPSAVRRFLQTHAQQTLLQGVLSAVLRAEELAAKVRLADLTCAQFRVHLGPFPAVRLCWRAVDESIGGTESSPPVLSESAKAPSPTQPPPPLPGPSFAEGGFFGRRTPTAGPPVVPSESHAAATPLPGTAPAPASTPATPTPEPAPAPSPSSAERQPAADWRRSALDRFKRMPDLSKRG